MEPPSARTDRAKGLRFVKRINRAVTIAAAGLTALVAGAIAWSHGSNPTSASTATPVTTTAKTSPAASKSLTTTSTTSIATAPAATSSDTTRFLAGTAAPTQTNSAPVVVSGGS